MRNFFYDLMYNKKQKRVMEILYDVDKNLGSISLEELYEALGITKKTLMTDLDYLKTHLPTSYTLQVKNDTLSIKTKTGMSLQLFIFDLAENSILYQLIQRLLINQSMNIHTLAEELFISESSLRNRIAHYNTILEKFSISISSYHIKFVGSEINIRLFLHIFYMEFRKLVPKTSEMTYSFDTKLFSKIKSKLLEERTFFLNTTYYKLAHWLLLSQIRMSKGCFVTLENKDLENAVEPSLKFDQFKLAYKLIEEKVTIPPERLLDEQLWGFVTVLHTVIYSANEKRLGMYYTNMPLPIKNNIPFSIIYDMAILLDRLGDGEFFVVHFAFFRNFQFLTMLSPVYQIASSSAIDEAKDELRFLYDNWYKILLKYQKNLPFEIPYMEDFCSRLSLITSQFYTSKKVVYHQILASFTGESGMTVFLENKLLEVVNGAVEIRFAENNYIDSNIILHEHADLIITNFSLPNEIQTNIAWYQIPYMPSTADWIQFSKFIRK